MSGSRVHQARAGQRLAGAAAILVAAIILLLGTLMAFRIDATVQAEYVAQFDGVGRSMAEQIGTALDYGIPFASIPGMDDFLKIMAGDLPGFSYVGVYDAAGQRHYALGTLRGGREIRVVIPVQGEPAGIVVLQAGRITAVPGGWRLWGGMVFFVVLGAGLAALTVGGLYRLWIVRQVLALRRGLQALARGERGQSFPEDAAAGIGSVARAAAQIQANLERSHAEFMLEVEEIALAQPDAARREQILSLAAQIHADSEPTEPQASVAGLAPVGVVPEPVTDGNWAGQPQGSQAPERSTVPAGYEAPAESKPAVADADLTLASRRSRQDPGEGTER